MKIRSFSDRLLTDCDAELVVFLVGGIAATIAHVLFLSSADGYFSGFFCGVSMCAVVLSVLSAIRKMKQNSNFRDAGRPIPQSARSNGSQFNHDDDR